MLISSRLTLVYEAYCFVTQIYSYQRIFVQSQHFCINSNNSSTMVTVPTSQRSAGRRNVAPVSPPSNGAVVINPILRHMNLSTKIRSLRTKESTKKQYLSQATIFKQWVHLNHSYLMETVADLPWISNVNDHQEILEDFFGHIVRKEQMMIHTCIGSRK